MPNNYHYCPCHCCYYFYDSKGSMIDMYHINNNNNCERIRKQKWMRNVEIRVFEKLLVKVYSIKYRRAT